MAPTLVILAAGLGRRFGGMKQLEAIGPGGATLMDYAIYDARRAGFGRIVFVIRPEIEDAFRSQVMSRFEGKLQVDLAFQRLDIAPAFDGDESTRTRPWGTGHAVLSAADVVRERFVVANADDFYGAEAFELAQDFLLENQDNEFALVSYALRDTLSEAGAVNRGICQCDDEHTLLSIVEARGITRLPNGDGRWLDANHEERVLPGYTRVSMNLWVFTPRIFDILRDAFHEFLKLYRYSEDAELFLPDVVQSAIAERRASVRVLNSPQAWMGVTYPADREPVAARLRDMALAGVYPERLWE